MRSEGQSELLLRCSDVCQRAQVLEMGGADVGDHADVRTRDLGQPPDLSGMVHPHLEDREILFS